VPDEDLAALLGGKAGRQWLRLQGVRRTPGGRPICRTTVYVHPDCLAVEPLVRDHKGPIYQLIEQTCGVRVMEVRQEIAAEPMPADIARSLGEKTGACALRITRRYVGENDMPVEVSVNHHPAEGFSYQMRLRRDEIGGA
jgi:DNA-binding GntR family transcriptional regulator